MSLPSTLKNFNLFNDGASYMGIAEEIKLPKLKRKMEAYRAGGMNGPVKVDLGQEGLEMEFTCAGSATPRRMALAWLVRFGGYNLREIEPVSKRDEKEWLATVKGVKVEDQPLGGPLAHSRYHGEGIGVGGDDRPAQVGGAQGSQQGVHLAVPVAVGGQGRGLGAQEVQVLGAAQEDGHELLPGGLAEGG